MYSGLVGVLATPIVVGCGARPPVSLKPAVIVPIVPPDAHDAGNVATAASFDAGTTAAVMPVETAEPGSLADVTSDLDGAAAAPTSQRSNGRLS